ncbi:MAG: O-antigen ligase family protein [Candidatus Omnitrophica bacterium]|nr:O-antigen ligase family protein [Candidatus Omnitrophota bacterium]
MQYLGICIIIQDGIYDQKIIRRGVFIFLLGAALVVLSGLSQYFFNIEFLRNRSIAVLSNGLHAATSSFSHYNAFGGYLVVVLSLVSALLLANNYSRLKTNSLSALAILSTTAIILTFSRGSWLAMFISFIFMTILSERNLKRLIPVFLVIIILFLFPIFHERLFLTFKAGGDSDRFRYWLVAWKMINEHPFFGMGLGTFMANFPKFLPTANISYAHNCYLQIWAETGIFALFSFGGFIVSVVYFGIKRFIDSKDFVLLGLLSGVVGFLLHSFFETNLYSLRLAILFWVWVGLIIVRTRNEQLPKT